MQKSYLIDTQVLSELRRNQPDERVIARMIWHAVRNCWTGWKSNCRMTLWGDC